MFRVIGNGPSFATGSGGTYSRNLGFSGNPFEGISRPFVGMMYFFASGETAIPIRSVGRLIPGSPYSSGNLEGGVFFPPGGPTGPFPIPSRKYFSTFDGSFWKGRLFVSLSRSRRLRRLRLIHAATAMAAMANTVAPTLATTMPASCGELNLGPLTGEANEESSAEAGAEGLATSASEVEARSLVV